MALTKVVGAIAEAATETTSGVVEMATEAEINTGTDTDRAVSPGRLKSAMGFSDYVQIADQTITFSGTLTVAHGLGRTPILVSASLINLQAEQNHSIGDQVCYALGAHDADDGVTVIPDATNLTIRFGAGVYVHNKSTGTVAVITAAFWTLRLRAWA